MHFTLALLAFGCFGVLSNTVSAADDPTNLARICDIRANQGAFIGKVVTIDAMYSTDSMVYSFFEDPTCQRKGMLDVGFKVPERDQSVSDFQAAKAAYCRERKMGMCMVRARMRVRGAIAETVGAHLAPDARYLVINLHSVLSYEFTDGR
jgi:hypothetical protein